MSGQEHPWDNEPEFGEWTHAGLQCFVKRTKHGGHLCGYVGVPREHPWWGRSEDYRVHVTNLADRILDVDKVGVITAFCAPVHVDLEQEMAALCLLLEAHGGITFTGEWPHRPGTWWFGFDCAHDGDAQPQRPECGGQYRNWAFVAGETNRLAEQIAAWTERIKADGVVTAASSVTPGV